MEGHKKGDDAWTLSITVLAELLELVTTLDVGLREQVVVATSSHC